MPTFPRLWQTLLEHLVLMQLLMPLVGALLVFLSARLGRDVVRQTALTNVSLTAALATMMLVHYAPELKDGSGAVRTQQMQSSFGRPGDAAERSVRKATPGVGKAVGARIAVAVDGMSLFFVAAINLLYPLVIVTAREIDGRRPGALYVLLLLLQLALAGVFSARDFILFWSFLCGSSVLLFALMGGWSRSSADEAAMRMSRVCLTGDFLVMSGLIGLMVGHAWIVRIAFDTGPAAPLSTGMARVLGDDAGTADAGMTSVRTLTGASLAAARSWRTIGAAVLGLLLAGFACRGGFLFGVRWLPEISEHCGRTLKLLILAATFPIALYGIVRFVLPLMSPAHQLAPAVIAAAAWSLAVSAVALWQRLRMPQPALKKPERTPESMHSQVALSQFGIAAAALCSQNTTAACGGVMLSIGSLAGLMLLVLANPPRPYAAGRESSSHRFFGLIGRLSLAGLPGLSGFIAMLAVLQGLFIAAPVAAACALLAWVVNAWLLLDANIGPKPAAAAEEPAEHTVAGFGESWQPWAMFPAALLLTGIGLVPHWVIARLAPTISVLLQRQ